MGPYKTLARSRIGLTLENNKVVFTFGGQSRKLRLKKFNIRLALAVMESTCALHARFRVKLTPRYFTISTFISGTPRTLYVKENRLRCLVSHLVAFSDT